MNVGVLIFNTLRALVASRVHPDTFPQQPTVPAWPSIRYTVVSGTAYPDLCGDGTSDEDDARVQLDIVCLTATERHTLTEQVRAAMKTMVPPAIMESPPSSTFDAETKTFRCTIDYTIYGSTL